MFILKLFLLLMLITCTVEAATRYVSTTGSDANSCAASTNVSTPKRNIMGGSGGLACMSAGDTLYLKQGTYAERINSNNQTIPTGTSWSNAITIASAPGETAILKTSGGALINLYAYNTNYHIQYIIFDRLVLDAVNITNDNAMTVSGKGSFETRFIRFKNGEIKDVFQSGGACLVSGNNHPNVGGDGHHIEFLQSKIHHSKCSYAFYISGNDWLLDGNEIYNNGAMSFQVYVSGGTGLNNNIIRNNKIYNNGFFRGTAAVSLNRGDNIQFYNNLVYDNNGGVDVGISGAATNLKFYNNTIHGNGSAGPGLYIESGSTGALVRNNINYNNSGQFTNNSNATFSNNLCSSSGTGCASTGTASATFANEPGNDFHLKQNSPAINIGANLIGAGITTDIEGKPRPEPGGSIYDVGAYECQNLLGALCQAEAPQPDPVGVLAAYAFEEGSGTTTADLVGQNHHCTLNTSGWATGIIGNFALDANGVRYCSATGTAALKPTTQAGLSVWSKRSSVGANGEVLATFPNDAFLIYLRPDGQLTCQAYDGTSFPSATGGNGLGDKHVSCSYKQNDGVRLRVNNAQVAFTAMSTTLSYTLSGGGNLQVGRSDTGPGYEFGGVLDQFYALDTEITPEANTALFEEQVPQAGLVAALSRWGKANQSQGNFLSENNQNRLHRVNQPISLRYQLRHSGTSISQHIPWECQVDGAGFVPVSDSFGTLNIQFLADSQVSMGDVVPVLLAPDGGFTHVNGYMTAAVYDNSKELAIDNGQVAEVEVRLEFHPDLAGTVVQCRPTFANFSPLDDYGDTVRDLILLPPLFTLNQSGIESTGVSIQ